jgi:phytoene dehydrogenase-like protein
VSDRCDVVVIGAGSNGLAAAATLARAGKKVIVVELADNIGGLARVEEFAPGFSSSIRSFHNGWVSPAVAAAAGVNVPAQITPGTAAALAAGGGDVFSLPSNVAEAEKQISRRSAADGRRWGPFVKLMRSQVALLEQLYQQPAPRIDMLPGAGLLPLLKIAAKTRWGAGGGQRVVDLLRTMPMSLNDLLNEWFEDHALKAVIAGGAVHGVRQGPYSGGTAFVLAHNLCGSGSNVMGMRPYYSAGPQAFVQELAAAARARGAQIRTSTPAARVLVDDYRTVGVLLHSGEELICDAVLSTADPVHTMLRLVAPEWLDPELRRDVANIKTRGHTAFVHYALSQLPPSLRSQEGSAATKGIVLLTGSLRQMEQSFDAVKYGELAELPHIEICFPSVRWPVMAPHGKDVISARVAFVPMQVDAGLLAGRVDKMIDDAFPGFLDVVEHRATLTPADIAEHFSVAGGCVAHGEMTLDQILFMRPTPALSQYVAPIEGLWLGGSGSHPGPGISGAAGTFAATELIRAKAGPR